MARSTTEVKEKITKTEKTETGGGTEQGGGADIGKDGAKDGHG